MPARMLLRGAEVLACSGDVTERPARADVLIHDDRIERVAPSIDVDEGDVRVVDMAGATVLPGLCDAHTHISWPLDFVFDHGGVAAAPAHRHALDVAAVTRTFIE